MPRAAILAIDGCYASSVAGYADLLQVANAHIARQFGAAAPRFIWKYVSLLGKTAAACNGQTLSTDSALADEPFDIVFVPSFFFHGQTAFNDFLVRNRPAVAWLERQWQRGAWLTANCTGTFLLAETGLLDNRAATTTWWLEKQFRMRYPSIDIQSRAAVTEDDRIVCGGAPASQVLQTLRVIERVAGSSVASLVARTMLLDMTRRGHAELFPLLVDEGQQDPLIRKAHAWFYRNLSKPIRLADLAERLGISERTLVRRFHDTLNQTPLAYLQSLRVRTARWLLETTDLTICDVAARVGYGDASSFSRLFRQLEGVTPGHHRNAARMRRIDSTVPESPEHIL